MNRGELGDVGEVAGVGTVHQRDPAVPAHDQGEADEAQVHPRLHLAHLAENAEALVARAESGEMGYFDLLDLVLEGGGWRQRRTPVRNALKLAGLPHHKGLDEFDFSFQPNLDPRKVKDLATLAFVEEIPRTHRHD